MALNSGFTFSYGWLRHSEWVALCNGLSGSEVTEYSSGKYKNASLIKICIAAYFLIALYGITLKEQYQFWILAVCVGIFQGAIQSLSRSYFARIIPAERSGEYFGIYDICGKGASFLGTTLVSAMSQLTGNMNLGVGSLAVMFLIGFFFFLRTEKLS